MSEASSHLRRIVETFRNNGISNEVRIAEHVAFLLLVRDSWDELRRTPPDAPATLDRLSEELYRQYYNLRIPAVPSLNFDALAVVLSALEEALKASPQGNNLGAFFQREIRFELLKATSGSQYPTPHHVATLMARLAVTSTSETVLDPTVGTGGLLVAAHAQNETAQLVGIDFDPQWVALASTNLILHGITTATMQVEQVLNQQRYRDELRFDSVLMNPPFGGTRSTQEIAETVGSGFGRTSSTVLAALALRMLKPDGIAAFLQPSGVLFGSGGEAHLRRTLMQDYALEAVITLPSDAMQPYSQVATHLLVARKAPPSQAVWFMTPVSDGYPAGTARDLTTEPNTGQNDLPRVSELVLATRANRWQTRLTLDGIGDVQTVRLDSELPGVGVRVSTESQNIKWYVSHLADGVLVKARNAEDTFMGWLYEPYREGAALRFAADQVLPYDWQTQLDRDDWAENIPSSWQVGSDNVTVAVSSDEGKITLQRDKTVFEFSQPNNANVSIVACLLDEAGQQIAPWLTVTDENRQGDIQNKDFGEKIVAMEINDAAGSFIGWLLDLTGTGDDQEQRATLLIVTVPECDLFTADNVTHYALMEHGWLEIRPDGILSVKNGSSVSLRADVTQGFAIGPATVSGEASHSLFGVLVPSSVFVDGDQVGDMRPSNFLPEPETVPLGHPLDVLASIRRSQTQLSTKVDSLLGILGQPGGYNETAETLADIPAWIGDMLDTQQQRLLQLLEGKRAEGKPRHFNELDVADWCQTENIAYSVDDVRQHLRLFMCLGLVKAVHTDGHNLYRMITTADIQRATEATQ